MTRQEPTWKDVLAGRSNGARPLFHLPLLGLAIASLFGVGFGSAAFHPYRYIWLLAAVDAVVQILALLCIAEILQSWEHDGYSHQRVHEDGGVTARGWAVSVTMTLAGLLEMALAAVLIGTAAWVGGDPKLEGKKSARNTFCVAYAISGFAQAYIGFILLRAGHPRHTIGTIQPVESDNNTRESPGSDPSEGHEPKSRRTASSRRQREDR